jgi:hypothetical protein
VCKLKYSIGRNCVWRHGGAGKWDLRQGREKRNLRIEIGSRRTKRSKKRGEEYPPGVEREGCEFNAEVVFS